jgi:uncharacterized protein YndB with AHSA1/START domain
MYAIKHYFIVSAGRNKIYRALTEQDGITGWWTDDCKVEPAVGSIAEFNFGNKYRNKMKILELVEDVIVHWECLEGDEEWVGTKFKFELGEDGEKTIVRFSHYDWREETNFYASCNFHWGYYMRSIQKYCETGTGTPFNTES